MTCSRLLEALYSGEPSRVDQALSEASAPWPESLDVTMTFAPYADHGASDASAQSERPQALYAIELDLKSDNGGVRVAAESVEVGGRIRKLARGYGGGSWFAGDTDPPETTDWVGHIAQPEGNNPVMVVLPLIGDALRSLRAARA